MEQVWSFVNKGHFRNPFGNVRNEIMQIVHFNGEHWLFYHWSIFISFQSVGGSVPTCPLCREALDLWSHWARLVGSPPCALSFLGPCESSRKARKGLKKSALDKGNRPDRQKDGGEADQRDCLLARGCKTSVRFIYYCLLLFFKFDISIWKHEKMNYQEAFFLLKASFFFVIFFSSILPHFHTKYLTHTFSLILCPYPCFSLTLVLADIE